MKPWLQRLFNVRREELLPVCLAGLFFFCVLVALMILRPAREALLLVSAAFLTSSIAVATWSARSSKACSGAWAWGWQRWPALASVAVPLALMWAALALWLGRTQQRMAAQLPMNEEHPPRNGGA